MKLSLRHESPRSVSFPIYFALLCSKEAQTSELTNLLPSLSSFLSFQWYRFHRHSPLVPSSSLQPFHPDLPPPQIPDHLGLVLARSRSFSSRRRASRSPFPSFNHLLPRSFQIQHRTPHPSNIPYPLPPRNPQMSLHPPSASNPLPSLVKGLDHRASSQRNGRLRETHQGSLHEREGTTSFHPGNNNSWSTSWEGKVSGLPPSTGRNDQRRRRAHLRRRSLFILLFLVFLGLPRSNPHPSHLPQEQSQR